MSAGLRPTAAISIVVLLPYFKLERATCSNAIRLREMEIAHVATPSNETRGIPSTALSFMTPIIPITPIRHAVPLPSLANTYRPRQRAPTFN
jgi:hypothetical protein